MLKRNGVTFDTNKFHELCEFIKTHGKSRDFWQENAQKANTSVDKNDLDRLFEEND